MPGPKSGNLPLMKLSESVVLCFDTETTGLDEKEDRVIELGAAYSIRGARGPTFMTLVNPLRPIPPEASKIHGIVDADVAAAPTWAVVAQKFMSHLAGDALEAFDPWHEGRPVLAGYNAVHFDGPFINAEQSKISQGPLVTPSRIVDPVIWIRWHSRDGFEGPDGTRGRTLKHACHHFGVALGRAHRADADARATLDVLLKMAESGVLPDEIDDLLEAQADLAAKVEWERAAWGHYLYYDRAEWAKKDPVGVPFTEQAPHLRLGFGKHSGEPLEGHGEYVRFCLKKFGEDIHPGARAHFQRVAG